MLIEFYVSICRLNALAVSLCTHHLPAALQQVCAVVPKSLCVYCGCMSCNNEMVYTSLAQHGGANNFSISIVKASTKVPVSLFRSIYFRFDVFFSLPPFFPPAHGLKRENDDGTPNTSHLYNYLLGFVDVCFLFSYRDLSLCFYTKSNTHFIFMSIYDLLPFSIIRFNRQSEKNSSVLSQISSTLLFC